MIFARPDWGIHTNPRTRAHLRRIAPQVRAGIFSLAASMHPRPRAKGARAHNGGAMRGLQREGRIRRIGQPGQSGRVHRHPQTPPRRVAAFRRSRWSGSHCRSVRLCPESCPAPAPRRQESRPCVGDSQPAVGVAMEAKPCVRMCGPEFGEQPRHLLRTGAAGCVAENRPAHLLRDTLRHDLLEVFQAALGQNPHRTPRHSHAVRKRHPAHVPDRPGPPAHCPVNMQWSRGPSAGSLPAWSPATSPHPAGAISPQRPRPGRDLYAATMNRASAQSSHLAAPAASSAKERELHRPRIHSGQARAARSPTNWFAPAKPISA